MHPQQKLNDSDRSCTKYISFFIRFYNADRYTCSAGFNSKGKVRYLA